MPRTQQVTSSGQPAAGYYISFFETDGTTAKTVYSDEDLTTPHEAQITADSAGRFPAIYVTGAYKIRLYDQNGTIIFTESTSQSGLEDAFYEEITGDDSTVEFTLSEDLGTDENAVVIEKPDGTTYAPADFTIDGVTLTFDSAPASGTYKVRAPSLSLGAASSSAAAAAASEVAAAISETNAAASEVSAAASAAAAASGTLGDLTALTEAVVAPNDIFPFSDTSDSGNNKRDTIQGIIDLAVTQARDIDGLDAKATPADADTLLLKDTEASNAPKEVTIASLRTAVGWSTGDVKLTLKTVADTGWVMFNDGTIGNAASGGTTRANADTEALFTLLWTNVSNTYAAVSGGRGASAAADYAANKTIALTKMLGRALGIAGAGSGLTSRAIGFTVGEETHVLLEAEMPAHTHSTAFKNDSTSAGTVPYATASTGATAANVNTSSKGSGTAHNNMQPTTFLNAMVKL